MTNEEQKAYGLAVENHERAMSRVEELEREVERQKMNCLNLHQQLEDLKARPTQPGEAVEVVAWLFPNPDGSLHMDAVRHDPEYPGAQPVMTVAQHQRIVAALAEIKP